MPKTLKVSDRTHQLLVRAKGALTAELGKQLTFDETIALLVQKYEEGKRQVPEAERKQPEPW
jgi:hypothetical protein